MTTDLPIDLPLLTDPTTLEQAADDFGHLVHLRPRAVLQPRSIDDVVELVRRARTSNVPLVVQGQAHSTFGHAQVEDGIVIRTSSMARVHHVSSTEVEVDAGARWDDLLRETMRHGSMPPTLIDYLGLSVGGTLSVGGIGSQSFRFGAQTDNVVELTVVTGTGDVVICSATREPELFDACRAGLGQFGVIVRARLRLVEAPVRVRYYKALYLDLAALLADQQRVIDDGRFDSVEGSALPNCADEIRVRFGEAAVATVAAASGGRWLFQLKVAKNFGGDEPDDDALLSDLSFMPGLCSAKSMSGLEFATRLAPEVEIMRKLGLWQALHPWVNVLLPSDRAVDCIAEALDGLTHEAMGRGPILLYGLDRQRLHTPGLRLPDSRRLVLFGLLRNATTSAAAALTAQNLDVYRACRRAGGTLYPIGSVALDRAAWIDHFGGAWADIEAAKRRYDPDTVFRPSYGPW